MNTLMIKGAIRRVRPCKNQFLSTYFLVPKLNGKQSVAPWLYTKIMKPVINVLRERGLLAVVYLDDWLCFGKTKEKCAENIEVTKQTLESLGFLVGRITAACPAVQYGWLYINGLERIKYLALLKNNDDYERQMKIPSFLSADLDWWEGNIKNSINPIKQQKFELEIFSDVSTTGCGAACNGEVTYGAWDQTKRTQHINYLELKAAFFGLTCFAADKQNCEILLRIDNITAVSYINRMGGMKYPKLNAITRKIWQWCEERKLWLFASYIASKENVEADWASRIVNIDTEWELAPWAFQNIISRWSYPKIDLFASRINKKYTRFCSWHHDPEAFCVDVFTLEWTNYKFYAFPPFSLILRVLRKIQQDQAQALVTAHRKQTLSLIKVSNIRKTKKGYEIKILDKMKVTRPGAYQLLLVIPKLETKPALCVANTLERYLLVTNELRSDCDNLLLTTRSPYKKATKTPLVDGYEPS
ncbi:reverse transcriptase and recombinase [Lasius niger]|uniref:Reverse transcriptase and recombinase n=1 Tax=Lasius niger TaxID=67767 RepID=A0A0J7KB86_LASNI|nr:reverse transcriptase and recombinase [Lasius niger]